MDDSTLTSASARPLPPDTPNCSLAWSLAHSLVTSLSLVTVFLSPLAHSHLSRLCDQVHRRTERHEIRRNTTTGEIYHHWYSLEDLQNFKDGACRVLTITAVLLLWLLLLLLLPQLLPRCRVQIRALLTCWYRGLHRGWRQHRPVRRGHLQDHRRRQHVDDAVLRRRPLLLQRHSLLRRDTLRGGGAWVGSVLLLRPTPGCASPGFVLATAGGGGC